MDQSLYSDERLLRSLPFAKGWDREILVMSFAFSDGPGTLNELVSIAKGAQKESALVVSAALQSLGIRSGSSENRLYAQALRSRQYDVQLVGAKLLARYGDAAWTDEMHGWIERKLARTNRLKNVDHREIPAALIFADRVGELQQFLSVVQRYVGALDVHERAMVGYNLDAEDPLMVQIDMQAMRERLFPEDAQGASFWSLFGDEIERCVKRADRRLNV